MANCGDKVKHFTGVEGIVMGITNYLYGCRRIHIQPLELKDGRPQDYITCDEPEVVIITTGYLTDKREPVKKKSTGGSRAFTGKKNK